MASLVRPEMATDRDVDVPDPDHPRIVADDSFGGEPRVRGRRITVLDVYDRVDNGDTIPREFAETFRLDLADVYAALAYYHANEEKMERHREARKEASESLRERVARERPSGVEPNG